MPVERKYWFRAKRYGWGWGLPTAWQGWVVMALFSCLLLVAVCWAKGEPPRWRWGGK